MTHKVRRQAPAGSLADILLAPQPGHTGVSITTRFKREKRGQPWAGDTLAGKSGEFYKRVHLLD